MPSIAHAQHVTEPNCSFFTPQRSYIAFVEEDKAVHAAYGHISEIQFVSPFQVPDDDLVIAAVAAVYSPEDHFSQRIAELIERVGYRTPEMEADVRGYVENYYEIVYRMEACKLAELAEWSVTFEGQFIENGRFIEAAAETVRVVDAHCPIGERGGPQTQYHNTQLNRLLDIPAAYIFTEE